MNRQEFLWQLRNCLNGHMPPAKVEDIIAYYDEYFHESGAEGEAAVMAELGDPREVAARILGAETAWEAPPPVWKSAGFADYGAGQAPRRRKHGILFGVCAAFLAITMVGVILRNTVGHRYLAAVDHLELVPTAAPVASDYFASADAGELTRWAGLAPFSNLEFDLPAASVDIVTGDEYAIELIGTDVRVQYDNGPDGLRVWQDGAQEGTATAIERAEAVLDMLDAPHVIITLPKGASLGDVKLSTGLGSINAGGVSCRSMALATGLGGIAIYDITAQQLGISVSGGTCSADRIIVGEAGINGAIGTLDLYDSEFGTLAVDWQGGRVSIGGCLIGDGELRNALGEISANDITSYGLRVSGQNGAISLWGTLSGITTVTQSLGTVDIGIVDLPAADFSYDLETSLGTITVDGEVNRGHVANNNSEAPNRLSVQNQSGAIDVFFGG